MVTHRRAFSRATAAQTLAAVLEDDPTASAPAGSGTTRAADEPCTALHGEVAGAALPIRSRFVVCAVRGLARRRSQPRRSCPTLFTDRHRCRCFGTGRRSCEWMDRIETATWASHIVSPPVRRIFVDAATGRDTRVRRNAVALSADGQQIVYAAVRNEQANLHLKKLNQVDPVLLPGTSGASQPIFSPDGESIAFAADGALKVLRLSGGSPTAIASVKNIRGASWGDDDRIVYAPDVVGGLFRVSSRGGVPEQVTEVDKTTGENSHRFPHVLPGAGALVFMTSDGQQATVSALDLRSRRRVDGLATGHGPQYLPSGHLAFVNSKRPAVAPAVRCLEAAGARPADNTTGDSGNRSHRRVSRGGRCRWHPRVHALCSHASIVRRDRP